MCRRSCTCWRPGRRRVDEPPFWAPLRPPFRVVSPSERLAPTSPPGSCPRGQRRDRRDLVRRSATPPEHDPAFPARLSRVVEGIVTHIAAQAVAQVVGFPVGPTKQVLHPIGVGGTHLLGQLPAILALSGAEQTAPDTPWRACASRCAQTPTQSVAPPRSNRDSRPGHPACRAGAGRVHPVASCGTSWVS
jgi:hypothetical protein